MQNMKEMICNKTNKTNKKIDSLVNEEEYWNPYSMEESTMRSWMMNGRPVDGVKPSSSSSSTSDELVQCIVRRELDRTISFAVQSTKDDSSQKFVYVAKKISSLTSPHMYQIMLSANKTTSNDGKDSAAADGKDAVVATLKRYKSTLSYVVYGLWDTNQTMMIACIWYKVHSVVNVITDGTLPPRSAQLAIVMTLSEEKDKSNSTVKIDGTIIPSFEKRCNDSLHRSGNLDGVVNASTGGGITKETTSNNNNNNSTIVLFRTKECYTKSTNGRSGLNFKGRGRIASTKNIQLVVQVGQDSEDSSGGGTTPTPVAASTIRCQMAKWDTNTFHVDYQTPMCSLYAFSFAIAQLDL